MAALGLLAPADEAGRFRVGADLARIGQLVAEHLDIRREGRPFLERASAAIGETVVIAVYDPVRRQFSAVDAVETSHPIRYLWESLRDWSDLHLGSSGKGILAFLPPDEQAAILDRLPDPVPGRTALTKARLREELEADRRRGYVVSHGERYEGAVGRLGTGPRRPRPGRRRPHRDLAGQPHGSGQGGRRRGRRPVRRRRPVATPRLDRRERFRDDDTDRTPPMTEPIRIGIVGAGRIVAAEHVPRFRAIDGVELVGVANRSEESAQRAAGDARARRAPTRRGRRSSRTRTRRGPRRRLAGAPRAGHDRRARGRQARPDRGADGGDAPRTPGRCCGPPAPTRTGSRWSSPPRSPPGRTARSSALLRDGAIGRVRHVQVALGCERAGRSGRLLALAAVRERRERHGPRHPGRVDDPLARTARGGHGRHPPRPRRSGPGPTARSRPTSPTTSWPSSSTRTT